MTFKERMHRTVTRTDGIFVCRTCKRIVKFFDKYQSSANAFSGHTEKHGEKVNKGFITRNFIFYGSKDLVEDYRQKEI